MNKKIKFVLITIIIIGLVTAISYLVFAFGITDMISANLQKVLTKTEDYNQSDLPVIEYVINSSGEKLVNTDVVLTVQANSIYDIKKIEYTSDFKKWTVVDDKLDGKEINYKIVFKDDMNERVYIRVENVKGYKSYGYETVVKIDKEKPKLSTEKLNGKLMIKATDNIGISSIQYSNDGINWNEEEFNEKDITLYKENLDYKYIRVVDLVGNISSVKTIK